MKQITNSRYQVMRLLKLPGGHRNSYSSHAR